MHPFRLLIMMVFFCSQLIKTYSQATDPNIHIKHNIYSPDAATLGKFGQIPVSYFNGTTQISVPLYELNYRDINVPISLNYNSSGNMPDNQPGWVGLGWSLQHGGCIIRSTNGYPDEEGINHPYGAPGYNYYEWKEALAVPDWKTKTGIVLFDGPDEFSFNFLGMSGSF